VTLETNPETATPARLTAVREAGVNRISFGVQSFDDGELTRLGRVHSAARAEQAVRDARRAGMENVSFDLMLWLPGQSRQSWRETVHRAIDLAPDHLSMYLLELYPNAPLKDAMARARSGAAPDSPRAASAAWAQAADDEAADMYLEGLGLTDEAGYVQYEISNVSHPGFTSRHNLKYWQAGSWRGFGCGAHSTVDHVRWRAVSATATYVDRILQGETVIVDMEQLAPQAQAEETLFTGLRLAEGIDRAGFRARFAQDPWLRYADALQPCVDEGLMWVHAHAFGLTRRGMLVANEILTAFV
jgi:oxygen-independent coproporphyrinogen-3 oxidase